ncbi:MAG TPA: M23 family metallopeptidase [Thermoanaerobaculia bacterium]|nr:M23 family metallopeptidase [Thermoanaerobaculia bacterium]
MRPSARRERRGGSLLLAGLGGFALGAATVLLIVWVYGARRSSGGAAGGPGGVAANPTFSPPLSPGPRVPGAPPGASGAAPGGVGAPPAPGGGPELQGGGSRPAGSAGQPGTPIEGARTGAVATAVPPGSDLEELQRRRLLLPVQGVPREQLRDSFTEARGNGRSHEALDIMAPRSSPVLAVEDGRIAKLFYSRQGGNTLYQFDPSETYAYYYAHLERYADGLHDGDPLRRGQIIGYVGTTGNAPPGAPHLHFAIFHLSPDKHWWQGTALDPFPVFKQP